ncbi:MAG: Nicotinate phosphoribosyltransferase pncB2 [Chlamydiae bacterium]|nr:Nicotinate phosphoribosyltransferase pncB2 [Chlamydiota bacterium]
MIYQTSLALLTDLYELTMAYGYWKLGIMDREAVFTLFFRRRPFQGSFAIAAGLESAIDFIKNFKFEESDLSYLEGLKTFNGKPLFEKAFLDYLKALKFTCDIDAMVEGTPVFPYEPLIRVKGPILQAQLLESSLLNIINYQTLIATKASRVCAAAEGDEVMEFGLRRAQGIDGSLSGARASYIGGCHSTSNVLAGKIFGIPVRGTHAHSWIMAFDSEEEAFDAYCDVMPNNCIFLVDTYNSIEGVKRAINVANRRKEVKMVGVRLDSGDLAHLSIQIRKMLDDAGYHDTLIMASNELDEVIIRDLKKQGAKINLWGVGTNLITAKGQPALDGVYKLSAIQNEKGEWVNKLKISEQLVKTTNPGILQVRRYFNKEGMAVSDMIYDVEMGLPKTLELIDPLDPSIRKKMEGDVDHKDLLIPIFLRGRQVYDSPNLREIRENTQEQLKRVPEPMRRFLHPQPYFVGLERELYELKMRLIEKIKRA